MKVSIIGAGNVGGLLALRLLEFNLGEIVLIDIAEGLAKGKALDLEDCSAVYKYNSRIKGSQNFEEIANSNIVIITAGFARKPGMLREELLKKNALIVKDIALKIKEFSPQAIVLVVTNPVDILTYLVLKITKFSPKKVLGVGLNLDTARFINLISKELNISCSEIEAMVIGAHSETMLVLERFSFIKGIPLSQFLDQDTIKRLKEETINRGAKIVSFYGSGSAYFAPASATAEVVKAILKDERKSLCVSSYLEGEYGLKDICIGAPCILGKNGREKIIELELNPSELALFLKSADSLNQQKEILKKDGLL